MTVALDQVSLNTIRRFTLKLGLSALIATIGKAGYIIAASGWLALYAIFTAVIAVIFCQTLTDKSFNHWDELLWLSFASLSLRAIHGTLS